MEEVSTNGLVDKCEDLEGYECMEFSQCNPDKLVKTCKTQEDPVIDLGHSFVNVDIAQSPCKQLNQVCCQPGKVSLK